MVRRYIKKPVEIEAIKYTGHNGWYIEEWSKNEIILTNRGLNMKIRGHDGSILNVGDYAVRDPDGNFYFYTSDYFESEYDML
jgi:hypothetical protein